MSNWPKPETSRPTMDEIEENEGMTSCGEGCEVEPDGVCEHGHPTWMLRLDMI